MHDQTSQVDDLRLVALPSAINCAEIFVRFTLAEWRLNDLLADAKETVDLLVRTAIGPIDERIDEQAVRRRVSNGWLPGMLTIRLRLRGGCLVVELEDDRSVPSLTVPRELSALRGGVEHLRRGGQLIWCELPLPTGMDASAVPLPRRDVTRQAPARPPMPAFGSGVAAGPLTVNPVDALDEDVDPEVMQRILSALHRRPDDPPGR